MYLNSKEKKDRKINIRVSELTRIKVENYMKLNGFKSITDFVNVCIENKISEENTLISM